MELWIVFLKCMMTSTFSINIFFCFVFEFTVESEHLVIWFKCPPSSPSRDSVDYLLFIFGFKFSKAYFMLLQYVLRDLKWMNPIHLSRLIALPTLKILVLSRAIFSKGKKKCNGMTMLIIDKCNPVKD